MTYDHDRTYIKDMQKDALVEYKQQVSAYELKFYDMNGDEMIIPDRPLKEAYSEIDNAIYRWERRDD